CARDSNYVWFAYW
nr:immunoglobulin heavy chain junction region [Mus musculus]